MLEPGDINVKNTWRLFKLAVSSWDEGWGGGGGYSIKFYTGRLRPEAQILSL